MLGRKRYVVSVVGATALTGTLLTSAFADHGSAWSQLVRAAVKTQTIKGNLTVNNVLHVNKNESVYGRLYAHGGLQVLNAGLQVKRGSLSVTNGGIKTDSLESTGPVSAPSATISGNVTAGGLSTTGALSAGSLALTGAATVGSTLTAAGAITGNGLSAGTGAISGGSLTTTGDITGANITAHGNLSTTGTFAASAANFGNLTATGSVNFTNATVTGLNISGLGSLSLGNPSASTAPLNLSENGRTVQVGVDNTGALTAPTISAQVGNFQALVLGSSTSTAIPLVLTENGKSANVGVDSSGNLTTSNLLVSGTATLNNLVLNGTNGGLTTGVVTAPSVTGTTNPGPLTITGNGITLIGATTVNGPANVTGNLTASNNLTLSAAGATSTAPASASHIIGNSDVAGTATVNVPVGSSPASPASQSVTFVSPYSTPPVVVVTPTQDASQGSGQEPSIWVTDNVVGSATTGFTIHVAPSAATTAVYPVTFNYQVVGR